MLQKEIQTLSFIVAGDTMLGSSTDPFRYVRETSRQTDIFHLNLETTLGPVDTPQRSKAVWLNSPLSDIEWLLQLHPRLILNVANNHMLDFGIDALRQTIDSLLAKNIKIIGCNLYPETQCAVLSVNRIKIAFVGGWDSECNEFLNIEDVVTQINYLTKEADIIVASIHAGIDNTLYPPPHLRNKFHLLVDAGADIVLGHHPHFFQGYEYYKNGVIFYSLGNFQFKQVLEETEAFHTYSAMIHFKSDQNIVKNWEIIPIKLNDKGIPRLMTKKQAEGFKRHVQCLSMPLKGKGLTNMQFWSNSARRYLSGNLKAWEKRVRMRPKHEIPSFLRWMFKKRNLFIFATAITQVLMRKSLERDLLERSEFK